ncbi:hypothetical protein MW887_007165 [Aspergillus wentii]|nr:hypothetical protein MW887_007165 [Aspergillus wentii]
MEENQKRRRLNYQKCSFCRKDKKKCAPGNRKWPEEKCHRCIEMGFDCSANQVASGTQERSPRSSPLEYDDSESREILDISIGAAWFRPIPSIIGSLRKADPVPAINHPRSQPGFNPARAISECNVILEILRKHIGRVARQKGENGNHSTAMAVLQLLLVLNHGDPRHSDQGASIEPLLGHVRQLRRVGDIGTAFRVQEALLQCIFSRRCSYDTVQSATKEYFDIYTELQERVAAIPGIQKYASPPLHRLARSIDDYRVFLAGLDYASINDTNFLGCTALHVAAERNSGDITCCLAQRGASVNHRDNFGRTPAHVAAIFGSPDALQVLIENEADIEDGMILHYAVAGGNKAVMQLLLAQTSINPNYQASDGRTTLAYAVAAGKDKIIDLLLETPKVDPNVPDSERKTPLSLAAEMGNTTAMRILVSDSRVGLNLKSSDGRGALERPVRAGQENAVEHLLNTGRVNVNSRDSIGYTSLIHAVQRGNEKILRLLLEKGQADLNITDGGGRTPLSHAAGSGHEAIVRIILDTGMADGSLKDFLGNTPLDYAVTHGHDKVIQLLRGQGYVDIDLLDNNKRLMISYGATGVDPDLIQKKKYFDGSDELSSLRLLSSVAVLSNRHGLEGRK